MKIQVYIPIFLILIGCLSSPHPRLETLPVRECTNTETAFHCVQLVDVYDGDTIFVDLPGQHPLFGKRMSVRIYGIDTPEVRTKNACEKKKGLEAKEFLKQILSSAQRIDIVNVQKDKYFRVLGTVKADGISVAEQLIQHKLAYPYFGEKKIQRDWCKP